MILAWLLISIHFPKTKILKIDVNFHLLAIYLCENKIELKSKNSRSSKDLLFLLDMKERKIMLDSTISMLQPLMRQVLKLQGVTAS